MALRTPLSVTPHLYMGDSTGRPLDMGTVYFGEQDKDPEFYPINLFSDDALTLPLAQPVHTKGGYLYDKGDMVEPHAKEIIYSVKVLDSYGRKVFYKGAMMRNSWNDDVIAQISQAIQDSRQDVANIAAQAVTTAIDAAIDDITLGEYAGGVAKSVSYTVLELVVLAVKKTMGSKFYSHGFYSKGDCDPAVFEVQTVAVGDVFTDIGNGTLIGNDASVKVNATKKLKLIARDSVALSQLGGIKTAQSVTIKNDVIGSVILKNYRELVIDGFYTLQGTLFHYENNVIAGIGKKISGIRQGDLVHKYPIQSFNSDLKNIVFLNDFLEMRDFTLDGNDTKNSARDYTQDINLSYWGFGALICNVADFYIHDMHVKNTEAWGISYSICDKVHGENITFDQRVGNGGNKDGITGSGKRVTLNNLSGHTSDDLCATGTGKATLGGRDCGISVRIDVEYVHISNVEGVRKGGSAAYTGVGVYGSDGGKIKSVVIDNIHGDFNMWPIRFANYWYASEKVNIDSIIIRNLPKRVITDKKNMPYAIFTYAACKKVTIENIHYTKDGDTTELASPFGFVDSPVDLLVVDNVLIEQTNSVQSIALTTSARSLIKDVSFSNIKASSSDTIAQDKDLTSGVFKLIDRGLVGMERFTVKSVNIGNFKLHGHLDDIREILRLGGNKIRANIDHLELPKNDTDYIAPASGVVFSLTSAVIKDSSLYIYINGTVSIADASLPKDIATFGGFLGQLGKQEVVQYLPKRTINERNFIFIADKIKVRILAPVLHNTEASVGSYIFGLRMVMPII